MQDRRKHQRRLVYKQISLSSANIGTYYSYIRDISEGGVFVALREVSNIDRGTVLRMEILDGEVKSLVFRVKVMHRTPEGYGMAFVDFDFQGRSYPIEQYEDVLDKHPLWR